MKLLILNTDYLEFLGWLYARQPGLEHRGYDDQINVRTSLFGVADFYSSNLRKLGHEAWDIYFNNEFMQKVWAREHGVRFSSDVAWQFRLRGKVIPWFSRIQNSDSKWMYDILEAQIKYYKPDVVLNQAMDVISSSFLREMKSYIHFLVGQHAAPLPQGEKFECYDLVISSLPNFVEYFRKLGIPSELSRLGFESSILKKIKGGDKKISVSFIGGLSLCHQDRVKFLEYLCNHVDISIWGYGANGLSENSPIRGCYKGAVWGTEMYQILNNSKITLNHHINIAEIFANNMRLYEATGVGAFLVTDWKENLHEIFEPGKEVVAYRTPEECCELIQYYLEHDKERGAIAKAGQARTLRDHTYEQRIKEFVEIVQKYL